jgi:hypothetical protein
LQTYHFGVHREGRVFKIPSQFSPNNCDTCAHTLRQEFQAAFAAVDLADFNIFLDSDIVSEQQSHHYNLSPLHTSLSPVSNTNSTPATPNLTTNTAMEFVDNTKTYTDFRQVIYMLYPGSEEECKWSVADMDKLVGERSRLGVLSLGDLREYHCQFLAITTFLIGKTRLSTVEQSRAFARGLQAELWMCISQ